MSLSFWIRDYLFMPLATLRREVWWRNVALVLSMVIFGLWHKISWLFLIWGVYQGFLLLLHRRWQGIHRSLGFRWPDSLSEPIGWLVTFASINIGWILFRATDPKEAATMLAAVVRPGSYLNFQLPPSLYLLTALVICGYFFIAAVTSFVESRGPGFAYRVPIELRVAGYTVLFYIAFLHNAEPQSFIYFQF